MTSAELLRRLKKLARRRGEHLFILHERGKGSHTLVRLDGREAVVPHLDRELPTGTLHAVLRQLGLSREDLR